MFVGSIVIEKIIVFGQIVMISHSFIVDCSDFEMDGAMNGAFEYIRCVESISRLRSI